MYPSSSRADLERAHAHRRRVTDVPADERTATARYQPGCTCGWRGVPVATIARGRARVAPAPPGGDGGMVGASGHVALVRRKRGAQWYARGRINGRPFQRRLGPAWTQRGRPRAGWYTERTAREALAAYLTDVRRGVLPTREKTAATFADAAREWLRHGEHERGLKPSTVADNRYTVERRLIPDLGHLPLEAVTARVLEDWRARLLREGKGRRTCEKYMIACHGILGRARRVWGCRAHNAAADVEPLPAKYSGDYDFYSPRRGAGARACRRGRAGRRHLPDGRLHGHADGASCSRCAGRTWTSTARRSGCGPATATGPRRRRRAARCARCRWCPT